MTTKTIAFINIDQFKEWYKQDIIAEDIPEIENLIFRASSEVIAMANKNNLIEDYRNDQIPTDDRYFIDTITSEITAKFYDMGVDKATTSTSTNFGSKAETYSFDNDNSLQERCYNLLAKTRYYTAETFETTFLMEGIDSGTPAPDSAKFGSGEYLDSVDIVKATTETGEPKLLSEEKIKEEINASKDKLQFGDGSTVDTQETKAETLIAKFADILPNGNLLLYAISAAKRKIKNSKNTNKFTITVDPATGEIDLDGLIIRTASLSNIDLVDDAGVKVGSLEVIAADGGKLKINGFALVDLVNTIINTKIITTEQDAVNDNEVPNLKQVKGLIPGSFPSSVIDIDTPTGEMDFNKLNDLIDWLILRLNGGKNQTNKLNLYWNDNGELEIREDQNVLMTIKSGQVNFLNQVVEVITDTNNDLSVVNMQTLKTAIANAGIGTNKTHWQLDPAPIAPKPEDQINDNEYFENVDMGAYGNLIYSNSSTSGYITTPDYSIYVPENTNTTEITFNFMVGGEYADELFTNAGIDATGKDFYKPAQIIFNTAQLGRTIHAKLAFNIKDKNSAGKIYDRYKIELDIWYKVIKDAGVYRLLLQEFVVANITEKNKSGAITKPIEDLTWYLNDSAYTTDKQPLRIFIDSVIYNDLASGTIDLSDYYTKKETDDKLNSQKLKIYKYESSVDNTKNHTFTLKGTDILNRPFQDGDLLIYSKYGDYVNYANDNATIDIGIIKKQFADNSKLTEYRLTGNFYIKGYNKETDTFTFEIIKYGSVSTTWQVNVWIQYF